ncbi:uncharacterized protein LOC567472 [Danio rerio]|uniref:Uncharacterized LOC567472 n=1 Tax=Danio rerio TaxID=7955 RepID=A0A0G2KI21_DANRE|nr:uncharacterized protein LOC567472 [Danio rerio]|eukprot:NP_001122013.1 uncharacterized protein LOC567472 [Danio rerio]
MFECCQTPLRILLLIFIFMCMMSINLCLPVGRRGPLSFSSSLRLTRTIRTHVQQLLFLYKQEMFGNELFEYREQMLSSLPAVTVSYRTWLHMQDDERLRVASEYLQIFWTHLDGQRRQLERDGLRKPQRRDKRGRPQPTLCRSFEVLQIDLRDLMRQVNNQLNVIRHVSSSTKSPLLDSTTASPSMHHSSESTTISQTPTQTGNPGISAHSYTQSPQTLSLSERGLTSVKEETSVSLLQPTRAPTLSHSTQQTTTAGMSRWVLHLNGYVILRDLERYLSRLARDYTVLQTKY